MQENVIFQLRVERFRKEKLQHLVTKAHLPNEAHRANVKDAA